METSDERFKRYARGKEIIEIDHGFIEGEVQEGAKIRCLPNPGLSRRQAHLAAAEFLMRATESKGGLLEKGTSVIDRPPELRASFMARLQIELDDNRMAELETLMGEGGVKTKRELFNAALTLLRWAMRERRAGRIVASIDEKTETIKELEMPILSEVKPG